MCLMKCQAGAPVKVIPPVQTGSGKDFDKGAAMTTLAAAASSAKSCKGVPGTASVRVVFEASGRVSVASLQGPPFAGTPQGGCIVTIFRNAKVPPFDGAPVAVSKSVSIP